MGFEIRAQKRRSRVGLLPIVLSGLALIHAGTATAQSSAVNPQLTDRWAIWLGGFFPQFNSDARLDSAGGTIGDRIDLENILGLEDSKSVVWGGARWRISRRNQLELEITDATRKGFRMITEDLTIDDTTLLASGSVATDLDISLYRLTYGYSLIKDDKKELALKAGVHLLDAAAQFQLEGEYTIVGDPSCDAPNPPCTASGSERLETDDIIFPLPHLGASFLYAFSPKLALRTQALLFALKISDFRGTLLELDLDLNWQPWKNFGFGAGARFFQVTVSDSSADGGKLDYNYWGPVVYGEFTF